MDRSVCLGVVICCHIDRLSRAANALHDERLKQADLRTFTFTRIASRSPVVVPSGGAWLGKAWMMVLPRCTRILRGPERIGGTGDGVRAPVADASIVSARVSSCHLSSEGCG